MRELSARIRRMHVSPIRKVAALLDEARERGDIISFGGGAPSVPPPHELLAEFTRLIKSGPLTSFGYTGTRGIPELREAVAEDAKKYGRVQFDPATEIMITGGGTAAIFSAVMALVDFGDDVIITDPTYLGYREVIELAQGRAQYLPVSVEDGYQPSAEQLKKLVSKKTKAVIALSPDNPTGRILQEDFLRTLVDLANDFDFWIVSDDAYKHIVYESKHTWISGLPVAMERTITICTFSKEAGLPGSRLGYTLAPAGIIDSMEKMQQYTTLAPEALGQFALVKFLIGNMKELYIKNDVLPHYRVKRELMGRLLRQYLPLVKTVDPQGAFYYFLDIRAYLTKLKLDEEQFAARLLAEKGVAVVPGGYFGNNGRGHVRLTFVSEPDERIEMGIKRIAEFASTSEK
jgi:aspartate aminotransferase